MDSCNSHEKRWFLSHRRRRGENSRASHDWFIEQQFRRERRGRAQATRMKQSISAVTSRMRAMTRWFGTEDRRTLCLPSAMKMDIDHETSHNGIGCGARAHE